jgi:dolichol-phosphate mannosyltransferase
MTSPTYSFVIPIYNEKDNLPALYERITAILTQLGETSEVILIDDGSRDGSYASMIELSQKDQRFKVIRLSRNFGHQIAISAGMDHATGSATIIMDADLQDPPEVVLQMVDKWKEGYEVVYGVRQLREKETFFKKITAAVFYRLLRNLSEVQIPADVGDFRLVDRKALDAFLALKEKNRYVRGMFSWIGFKQIPVYYVRHGRHAGETKYPLRKMLKLAKDGIISFSSAPLKLALHLGFLISGLAFLTGVWAILLKVTGQYTVTGWTSLAVMVAFLGGTQLIVIGILGEYISRIHDEVKGRPLYFVCEARGFDIDSVSKLRLKG